MVGREYYYKTGRDEPLLVAITIFFREISKVG